MASATASGCIWMHPLAFSALSNFNNIETSKKINSINN